MGHIKSIKGDNGMKKTGENHELKQSSGSLGKNLAVAAVAASLGVSLGVAVEEVLAAEPKTNTPPAYSSQHKDKISSKQIKLVTQPNVSNQGKFHNSKQLKLGTQKQDIKTPEKQMK